MPGMPMKSVRRKALSHTVSDLRQGDGGVCRLRSKSEQVVPGWVLVNVATPTDFLRLAGWRIGPRDNGLGGSFVDGC